MRNTELLPELLQNVEVTPRPRAVEVPVGVLGGELLGGTTGENAVGQAFEAINSLGIGGATDTVDNTDPGTFLV